jgi:hypothetical protein
VVIMTAIIVALFNADLASGLSPYNATVEAGMSRVRPVVLGAATAVLGVMPLLRYAFWVSMSMVIMAGLTFGTVITMVLVPTLYATFYRIPASGKPKATGAAVATRALALSGIGLQPGETVQRPARRSAIETISTSCLPRFSSSS